jgi:hypothetical protein
MTTRRCTIASTRPPTTAPLPSKKHARRTDNDEDTDDKIVPNRGDTNNAARTSEARADIGAITKVFCVVCSQECSHHTCGTCDQPVHNEVMMCSRRPIPGDHESGPLTCNNCTWLLNDKQKDDDDDDDNDDDNDEENNAAQDRDHDLGKVNLRATAAENRENFARILNNVMTRFLQRQTSARSSLKAWQIYDDALDKTKDASVCFLSRIDLMLCSLDLRRAI